MWNQITIDAVQACSSRPLFTVDHAVDRLEEMTGALTGLSDSQGQNPVRAFNDIYLQITKRTRDNIKLGVYADAAFMKILGVEFAKLYIRALNDWTRGAPVPAAWKQLFVLEHDGQRHTDFEGALLGVNAHINRDLTYALLYAAYRARKTQDWRCRRNDYGLVNDVFIEELDPIVNGLIESLANKPWKFMWKFVDACLGGLDEKMMFQAIVQFRSRAWKRAEDFWAAAPAFKPPATFERSRFSACVASMVLHSHTFDRGPFTLLGVDETASSPQSHRLLTDLETALPTAGEILVGSDFLSVHYSETTVKVTSPNRRIGGQWEAKPEDLYTLFGSRWLDKTLTAEPRSTFDTETLARTAETLSTHRSFITELGQTQP